MSAVKLSEISFSMAERDRRYALVRKAMRERGLDCIIIPHNTGDWDNFQPDLRYLTCIGGGGMAAAAVFPLHGHPIVAVREARRVGWWRDSQDWIDDVRSPLKFEWSQFFADALTDVGCREARIGVVGLDYSLRDVEGTMSAGELSAIQRALPKAKFECATDILYSARKRKSAEELALVRKAQACADAIATAFRQSSRPGASEHQVYASMMEAHVRTGGELPSMLLFAADKRFWQTQLLPTFRRLEAGDILMIEAEPKYYGYMAQAVDSVSLRALSQLELRLFEAATECFHAVLAEMKPGKPYAELIRLWHHTAQKSGCVAGRTMGHGLGLGQDGPLTTPGGDGNGLSVEEGDCFVLKPWVTDQDDTVAVRIGGTVIVNAKAAERIGRAPLAPHVAAGQ